MGKFGVGIGDEFPIDDGKPSQDGPHGPEDFYANNPDYEARRAEWRRQREAFREQRRQWREQWRAEWRERKLAFREEMRARYENGGTTDCYGYGGTHHRYWRSHRLFHLLAVVGLIVIAITVLSHIYVLFGLVVLAGLYFAYRGGFDHFEPFDFTPAAPRGAPPAPPSPPAPSADAPKG